MVLLDLLHTQRAGFFKFLKSGLNEELSQLNINIENTRLEVLPFTSLKAAFDSESTTLTPKRYSHRATIPLTPVTYTLSPKAITRTPEGGEEGGKEGGTGTGDRLWRKYKPLKPYKPVGSPTKIEDMKGTRDRVSTSQIVTLYPHPALSSISEEILLCPSPKVMEILSSKIREGNAEYPYAITEGDRESKPKGAEYPLTLSRPIYVPPVHTPLPLTPYTPFLPPSYPRTTVPPKGVTGGNRGYRVPGTGTGISLLSEGSSTEREKYRVNKGVIKFEIGSKERGDRLWKPTFGQVRKYGVKNLRLSERFSPLVFLSTDNRSKVKGVKPYLSKETQKSVVADIFSPSLSKDTLKVIEDSRKSLSNKRTCFCLIAPKYTPREAILYQKSWSCKLVVKVLLTVPGLEQPTGENKLNHTSATASTATTAATTATAATALPVLVPLSKSNAVAKEQNGHELFLVLGELPLMTKRGHFIINGSPRVILSQLVRTPGIYFTERDNELQADCVPEQGPWLCISKNSRASQVLSSPVLSPKESVAKTTPYVPVPVPLKGVQVMGVNEKVKGLEGHGGTGLEVFRTESAAKGFFFASQYREREKNMGISGSKDNSEAKTSNDSSLSKVQAKRIFDSSKNLSSYFCYTKQFSSMPFSLIYSNFRIFELHSQFTDQTLLLTKLKTLEKIRQLRELITTLLTFTWKKRTRKRLQKLYTKRCFTATQQFEKTKIIFRLKRKLILGFLGRKSFNEKLGISNCEKVASVLSFLPSVSEGGYPFPPYLPYSSYVPRSLATAPSYLPPAIPLYPWLKGFTPILPTPYIPVTPFGLPPVPLRGKEVRTGTDTGTGDRLWDAKQRKGDLSCPKVAFQGQKGANMGYGVIDSEAKYPVPPSLPPSLPPSGVRVRVQVRGIGMRSKERGTEIEDKTSKEGEPKVKPLAALSVQSNQKLSQKNGALSLATVLASHSEGNGETTLLSQDLAQIVRFLDGYKIMPKDDIDDLNNQRVRTSSDQVQQQVRVGCLRFRKMFIKLVRESWGVSQTITDLLNGALREFFGSNPLSQFLDQTNSLAEITHKRRISKLGLGGIQRESATLKVRTIHSTYFGRICPIETPEGVNAGLVNSLTCLSRVNEQGQLVTPLSPLMEKQLQNQFFYYSNQEKQPLSTTDTALLKFQRLPNQFIYTKNESDFQQLEVYKVPLRVQSDLQTISLATALIPFLPYDDANRALMGSNMQRQAVPLILPERPMIRTGLESLVISESGHSKESPTGGFVSYVSAQFVIIICHVLNKRSLSSQ